MARTYLKAVCECKEWSETDLVVVEDVNTLMSFAYWMKRRWHLNQPGIGWTLFDVIFLFVTGGFWFFVMVGIWLADETYLVGGYLRCVNCGSHLDRSAIRVPQVEMSVTTKTEKVTDTSMTSKLKEAAELHSQGIISDEEFQDLKSRILKA